MSRIIQNYMEATFSRNEVRRNQEIALLVASGHTEAEAEIIEAASWRAQRAAVMAVAKELDEVPVKMGMQSSACAHVTVTVAMTMCDLMERMAAVLLTLNYGGDARDITQSNSPDCDCSVCTATRAFTSSISAQLVEQGEQA